jgi:hypothetical protein
MIQTFIKDGKTRSFRVENNKVYTTIELDNLRITNPTLEQFKSLGWEEYVAPAPEPYVPTVEELVEQKLRERYSINQEFEVQRKRDIEVETFTEYYNFVEECITWAKQQPHRENE